MDQDGKLQRYDRQHDPARVVALTDGIFAIVITLLVLELHVPELAGGQDLREALREVRPSFIGFLISFLVTAIAWAIHRDLFAQIKRTDRTLVWLNLLYMLPLSILPFGAALISRYDQEPVALALYGILLLLITLTRLALLVYAANRPHLLYEPASRRVRSVGVWMSVVPAALYVLAILIGSTAPVASLVIYAAVPAVYFVTIFIDRSTTPPGSEEDAFS